MTRAWASGSLRKPSAGPEASQASQWLIRQEPSREPL